MTEFKDANHCVVGTLVLQYFSKLIFPLGSTNSSSNIVRLKPFSASVFKYFIWIIATFTKICNGEHSSLAHAIPSQCSLGTFTRLNIRFAFFKRSILSSFKRIRLELMKAIALSIFRVNSLDRYVVTRFLEDSNFHGHLPVVSMNQRLLWYRFANTVASNRFVRFIPHHHYILKKIVK